MDLPDPAPPIEVLVVDDSPVVRAFLSKILSADPRLHVGTVADPIAAMERMKKVRPAVIVLDVEMPGMNGITFLGKLMAEDPIPVVICSAVAGPKSELGLWALQKGAVDIIEKPTDGSKSFFESGAAARLAETVRAAASAKVGRPSSPVPLPAPAEAAAVTAAPAVAAGTLVGLAGSTGGVETVRAIVTSLPPGAPACVVVQQLPDVFLASFARQLSGASRVQVKLAEEGDRLLPGRVLVARGGRHLRVVADGDRLVVALEESAPVLGRRPSADLLFQSMAEAAGVDAVAVLLSGSGVDGIDGLAAIRTAGGTTLAQDEASSTSFETARLAGERGLVDEFLPPAELAARLLAPRR